MPEQTPAPVLVTLTLDTVTHYSYGSAYNEDGDRDETPVTIGDQVIEAATERIVKDIRGEVKKAVLAGVTEQITAQLTAVVAETLAKPMRKTNRWGEPEGAETSLASLIGEEVQAWMTQSTSNYDRDSSPFRKLVKAEVHDAMTKTLRDAIAQARKTVEGAVQAQAAQLIADAVKGSVR